MLPNKHKKLNRRQNRSAQARGRLNSKVKTLASKLVKVSNSNEVCAIMIFFVTFNGGVG